MARTVRSAQLETRSARLRLKARRKPYRVATGKAGLHLGYRRIEGRNGSWVSFTYTGKSGSYLERSFAQADDYADCDDGEILTYHQAHARLSDVAPPIHHGTLYTVNDAIDDYVSWLSRHRKSAAHARSNLGAYLRPYMGDKLLAALKSADFESWQSWALAHKPRGRLKDGRQAMKEKVDLPPEERKRRRRSRLNRIINDVLAALNHAHQRGRLASRDAWSRVRKYRGADSARVVHLTTDSARLLIAACEPDFRALVRAALLTGCRYGELTRLRVRDYDSASATILITETKSDRARRIPLTEEGQRLFAQLTKDRDSEAVVLVKTDGTGWGKSEQFRRIHEACEAAGIKPRINFHALRHTFASLLVQAGTPLAFVAEVLGHADTRMVSKHYAHLAPNVVHAAIRANLPAL